MIRRFAMTVVIAWTLFLPEDFAQNFRDRPWTAVFPAAAFVAVVGAWRAIRSRSHGWAFIASSTMIALLMASVAAALYPVMLPASNGAENSLTIYNAASTQETLTVMLVPTCPPSIGGAAATISMRFMSRMPSGEAL